MKASELIKALEEKLSPDDEVYCIVVQKKEKFPLVAATMDGHFSKELKKLSKLGTFE